MKKYCCILLLVSLAIPTWGQPQQARFSHIGEEQGLPHNFVLDILEDQDGLIWISTARGLSRYNGHRLRSYLPHVPDSLERRSHLPFIWDIYEAADGNIWLAAGNGLFNFNKKTGQATPFTGWKPGMPTISNKATHNVLQVRDGRLCASTYQGILCTNLSDSSSVFYSHKHYQHQAHLFEDEQGTLWAAESKALFRCTYTDSLEAFPIYSQDGHLCDIYGFFKDSQARYWIGTNQGLYRFYPTTSQAEFIPLPANTSYSVYGLSENAQGQLYIATGNAGLLLWDPTENRLLANYPAAMEASNGPASNFLYTLKKDSKDQIWIGTDEGLSVLHATPPHIQFLAHPGGKRNPLNDITIRLEDQQQNWWFSKGKDNTALFKKNTHTGQIDSVLFTPSLKPLALTNLLQDQHNNYWFTHPDQGLFRAAAGSHHFFLEKDLTFFKGQGPKQMVWDKANPDAIWMVTAGGLCQYDTKTGDSLWVLPGKLSATAKNNAIWRLIQHQDGSLWFFNSLHLCRYQPSDGAFQIFPIPGEHSHTDFSFGYLSNMAWNANQLYFATQQGLLIFDHQQASFELLTQSKTGHALSHLANLLVDEQSRVWLSRKDELIIYEPASQQTELFSIAQWCDDFTLNAAIKLSDGRLVFPSRCGQLGLDPKIPIETAKAPQVVLSNFLIRNQALESEIDPVFIQAIALPYHDNFFTLEYTALDLNQAYSYRYKMEGLATHNWVLAGKDRSVTFANVPPGYYTFVAEAMLPDGQSGPALRLPIRIRPAFWQTLWFKALLLGLAAAILFLLYRAKQRTQRLEEERRIAEQNTRYKSKFLSSVSHEIRTPLNAILGINSLLQETSLNEKQQYFTESIHLSCEKLLAIVNDLLDQAKIESGKFSLRPHPFDLRELIAQIERLLAQQFKAKGLVFRSHVPSNLPSHFLGDGVRIFQILMNLVGNALKFTSKGEVLLQISGQPKEDNSFLLAFEVKDTGIGIPTEKLADVFKDFEQIENQESGKTQGTGLGLSIAKELIELQGGSIRVASVLGQGTTFSFSLPLPLAKEPKGSTKNQEARIFPAKLRILLVDDTPINQFLTSEILRKFLPEVSIDTAANGEIAVAKANEHNYNLVLMDVRMPTMDGMQATRLIRQNSALQQLPIIGLTSDALASQIDACLKAGMNDCLSKPVRTDDLLAAMEKWIGS